MDNQKLENPEDEVVEVTKKKDGSTEKILLRKLPLGKLYTWCRLLGDNRIPALVALSIGKPENWLDQITTKSFGLLSTAAQNVNFPEAMILYETDPIVAAMIDHVVSSMTEYQNRLISLGRISDGLSKKLQEKASVAETQSESGTPSPQTSSSESLPLADAMPSVIA